MWVDYIKIRQSSNSIIDSRDTGVQMDIFSWKNNREIISAAEAFKSVNYQDCPRPSLKVSTIAIEGKLYSKIVVE